MIARLQQAMTGALVVFVLGWAAVSWVSGRPGWMWLGAAIVIGGYVLCIGLEFLLVAAVHRDDPVSPASAGLLWRAWLGEVLIAPRIFCWRQPFRSMAEPDFLPTDGKGRRGVVFVHGFFCNRGFWNPWMTRLRRRGTPFVAVSLEPPFGSISAYVEAIGTAVARIEAATGIAPVVVAHSMGGLAVRNWLAGRADRRCVHRVFTIGTPHRGTWLGRFGHTQNGREMRLHSPWLTALAQREGALGAAAYERFTCFYSACDNIVFPASTAMLPGADNRAVSGAAHVEMAFFDEVADEVYRWLELSAPKQ